MDKEYKIYNYDLKEYILLSMRDAYSYDLFPELSGITLDWQGSEVEIIFYTDAEINDEMLDHVDEIEKYFLSHMSEHTAYYSVKKIDNIEEMKCLREWAYLRYDLKDNEHFKK